MAKEKKKRKIKLPRPRFNQFGDTVAVPIPTLVKAWICPKCGAVSLGDKQGTPPNRCGNRKYCGRLFHQE